MNAPRTVTVNTLDHGPLTLTCPAWCTVEHDDDVHRVDVSHDGTEHVIAPGGREVLRALLTQAPFSNVDRTAGLYVEVADLAGTRTPDEVEQLADALVESAEQLRALGRQLAALLAGGEPSE
ncbi:DUF6907 domain-containing protein [Streptomyces sp. NPDC002285]